MNTIIGINYLGLVIKNYSLDKRNIAKQFQNIIKNVQNYLSQKKYEVARIELDKANKLSLDAEDAQAVQDWYRKIAEKKEMDHIATSQDDGNSVKDNNKVQTEKKVSKSQSSTDDFWNDSASSKSTTNKQTTVDKKASDDKMAIDKIYKIMEDGERQRQETQRKMDNWSNNLNTTFYAQQSAKSAYESVNENSRLSGNYSSVEELEAEFNEKYNSINQSVGEWKDAADESTRQAANLLFNNGTASGQAIGEFVGMAASLFNSGEKEKKEARERLEKQKQQYLAEFNAKKKAAVTDLRKKLLSEFPDGGTPLSKHNINQPEVYCFAYYFDQSKIGADNPEIYITNVFPIAQYSDGTWPFKNTLINEIKNKTKASQITLIGYYTQKEIADKMRHSLINLSGKAEMKATVLEYKCKSAEKNSKASSDDFWETGTSIPKKETKTTKSDDFWNN